MASESFPILNYVSGTFGAAGLEPGKAAWCWLSPLPGHRQGWPGQSCAIVNLESRGQEEAELNWGGGVGGWEGTQLLDSKPGSVCSLLAADMQLRDS